jgi:hypothetical protein
MDEVRPGFTGIITQKVGAARNIMRGLKKLPGRNHRLKSNLPKDQAGCFCHSGAVFYH